MEHKADDFGKIYEDFFPKIVRYLRRLVGDRDAEDVAQEAFIKVNASLHNFRGDSRLETWIYRIATNAAMDHLRKSRSALSEPIADDDSSWDEEDLAEEGSVPLLDRQLIRKEMSDCIRGIVNGLPENYRTVLILSDFEDLQNNEIARVLDISLETVKIRLHRARVRLKKELERHCCFYKDDRNELACDRKVSSIKFRKE